MISNRKEHIQGLEGTGLPSQLICLTLYNEESEALADTLVSVARGVGNSPYSPATVVAIIADGKDRISESSKLLLSQFGLAYQFDGKSEEDVVDTVAVTMPVSTVAKICGADNKDISVNKKITILLCTKNNNCGKLDSHWWFFKKIVPCYETDICFQIDAGTIIGDDAIVNMRKRFEDHPKAAALSSKVLIKSKDPLNLLETFQVGDFALQKTIMWPSESLLGYLSVIPGQFCGVRYSSLVKRSSVSNKSPLDLYLRGMECQSAFEKTMFLAEDRVMGFELLAHQGADNRLEYCEDAVCYTDECASVDEFLGQRRRWVNSAFMCRTWMMGSIFRYFRDSSSSVTTKAHTSLSLTSMAANHILEWFQPLINFLILAATFLSIEKLGDQYGINRYATLTLFTIIVAGWLTPLILILFGVLQRSSARAVNGVLIGVSLVVMLAISVNVFASLSGTSLTIRFLPSLFFLAFFSGCAWLSAIMLGGETQRQLQKSFIQYILLVCPLNLMMICYAFLNLDDSSWGTKGLCRTEAGASEESEGESAKLKRFRLNLVSLWCCTNISLMVSALYFQTVPSLLSVSLVLTLFVTITGVLGVFWMTLCSSRNSKGVVVLDLANEGPRI